VYKAHLVKMNSNNPLHGTVTTQTVAVKTLKGKCAHDHAAKLTSFSTCTCTCVCTYNAMIGFHDQEKADALLDEAQCMKSLDHPNILTLIGVCMDALSSYIVMPYMANGSLLAHLRGTNDYVLVNSREQRLVRKLITQTRNCNICI